MRHALIAAIFAVFTVASAAAQGPPASVNSLAPGRSFAPPASVNSLGPNGFSNLPVLLGNPVFPTGGFHIGERHRPHPSFGGVTPVFVPYYVPLTPVYMVPESEPERVVGERRQVVYEPAPGAEDESRYGVHDRERVETDEQQAAAPKPATPPTPPAPEQASSSFDSLPGTVLIFKDGHRLEITNYAIQGKTLFNLSGEGPRRIDTAELDVSATMKENDDRGVEFRLP